MKTAILLGGPDCGVKLNIDWEVITVPSHSAIYSRTDEFNKAGLRIYRFSYQKKK